MHKKFLILHLCAAFILVYAPSQSVAAGKESNNAPLPEVISFNAHVRPLMSNTCFVCHGPAGEENPSELRLDSLAAATSKVPSGDGQAIVPNDAVNSVVYQRITSEDADLQMPPPEFRHQLSRRDKAIIRRWIEQGAKYQKHWAYSPLDSPLVPKVAENKSQASNSIDAFVLARLAEHDLQPSPQADKAELLRRLSLDLIGLPPTPEELQTFLADEHPDAYERQVNRLLASPRYGERMASPWLDIVRFSDTVGFHGDQNQRIFPYRDYVINAFNSNKPFDEFTREQLAGDLLKGPNGEGPTQEQLTATGFVRLNMMTREGGAQPAEYMAKYTADRVRAIGTAWLGSTLGCCECHDHKYDPFSTKDFYSLGAFFADVRQWGVYTSYGYTREPELEGFTNDHPFPPELLSQSKSRNELMRYLQRESDQKVAAELPSETRNSKDFQDWLTRLRDFANQHSDGWLTSSIVSATAKKQTKLEQQQDDSLLLSGKIQKKEVITLALQTTQQMPLRALRLEALPDKTHNGNVGRAKNGSFRVELELLIQRTDSEKPETVKIAWAQPDHESPRRYQSGRPTLYLPKVWQSLPAKWQIPSNGAQLPHTAIYHFSKPLQLNEQDRLIVKLKSGDVGRVRFSTTPLAEAVPGRAALNEQLAKALSKEVNNWQQDDWDVALSAHYRATTPEGKLSKTCKQYRRSIAECRAGYSHTLIAQPLPAEKIPTLRVLPRGNWQDQSGEIVAPNLPHFLPKPENPEGRRLTRLDLANWLTSKNNPLTARHFMNRLWKQFFGAGLSNKLDDLGNQGEWPSHPQLLDWLASEFRDSGWDVKRMAKLIVMSRTYRQRAAYRQDLADVDPYNRLLSQQSARRLDAEAIRDNALAISGLLNCNLIGGPSVFPYQPPGYYSNLQFPIRLYVNSVDDRQYRRGVYMHWQRTFLHPMLANFDAPSRDECTADRVLSNSPQQALTLLNDPTFVEASRVMAQNLLQEMPNADFAAVLDQAFLRALSRKANTQEQDALKELYETQKRYFADTPQEAKTFQKIGNAKLATNMPAEQLAAWAQVCRVILNLHETITRY